MAAPSRQRPAALIPHPEAVPAELRSQPHWVVWRFEERRDLQTSAQKPTKVPYRADGQGRATTDDLATWTTFDAALAAYRAGSYDGIGFVLTPECGMVGTDFDACRDALTGAIDPAALTDVHRLDSYAEISPSGTGLRAFVFGTLPGGKGRNWRAIKVEAYDRGRFLTVTGQRLDGTPETIERRQPMIAALYAEWEARTRQAKAAGGIGGRAKREAPLSDDALIERAHHAKNGEKFRALWTGDASGYPSDSEADLALCSLLAFWCDGDADRIDRLFRLSGLYRDKWDRADYREATICRALEAQAPHVEWDAHQAGRSVIAETIQRDGRTKALADTIGAETRFATDAGRLLYRYTNGVYRPDGEAHVRRRVKALLEAWGLAKEWTPTRADAVVEYLTVDAPRLWERPPIDRLNVVNGIITLDGNTFDLLPHSPDFLSSVQIPVSYDPYATCPAWDRFIAEVFPEDAHTVAFELVAYGMTPDAPSQTAILLTGEGANGKSTFLRAVIALLGSGNCAGHSLHRLEGDRFAVAGLVGKLANICADLPSRDLEQTSIFKAITGGDMVMAERKFREAFEFRPFCKLLFSANHLPRSADATFAFFRRWLVLPFTRTFGEQGERAAAKPEDLDARLADPRELSGVLNKAIGAVKGLRERGFTVSASMREAWTEFRGTTDPLAIWLDAATVESPAVLVSKDALRTTYYGHCNAQSLPTPSAKAFGQALMRLRPHVEEAQRTIGGKVTWVWLGIGLRAGPQPDAPDASRDSRVSRDSASFCDFGDAVTGRGETENGEKERRDPVNLVNLVRAMNGSDMDDGALMGDCAGCGSFTYRPAGAAAHGWLCGACAAAATAANGRM